MSVKFWDKNFSSDIIPVMMGYLGYAKDYDLISFLPDIVNSGIKVKIYYGVNDWLGYKVYKKAIDRLNLGIETIILEGTGHQIPNLIPVDMSEIISKDLISFQQD